MAGRFEPPGECPVCGTDVPARAAACPECGACERSGWGEDARYDGLDLPDEAWSEPGQPRPAAPGRRRQRWLPWVAAVVLAAILWAWLGPA